MKTRIFALLAVVAFAGSLTGESATAQPEKLEMTGITNFSRIEGGSGFAGPLVGFGGATLPGAMPALRAAGYATVINLRLASEEGADVDASRAAAEAAGLQFVHLPLDTDNFDPTIVGSFLATVRHEENQPVYIHCGSATRASALWMIGRVLEDDWEVDAASEEVQQIAQKPDAAISFATLYMSSRGAQNPDLRQAD